MSNNALYPATSPYYATDVVNSKFLDIMVDRPIYKQPSDIYWEITLLYEYHRDYYATTAADTETATDATTATDAVVCNKHISILSITVILIGIFGVITVPETNELVHYTFAAAVFFSIVAFMVVHCNECKSSLQFAEYYSNLRIILYIQLDQQC